MRLPFFYSPQQNITNPERKLNNRFRFFYFSGKERSAMPLFTTDETGKAFEQFMKHQPNF